PLVCDHDAASMISTIMSCRSSNRGDHDLRFMIAEGEGDRRGRGRSPGRGRGARLKEGETGDDLSGGPVLPQLRAAGTKRAERGGVLRRRIGNDGGGPELLSLRKHGSDR